MRSIIPLLAVAVVLTAGCRPKPPEYGVETPLTAPSGRASVWAVAPAVNLSGVADVDPLLQADAVYAELQQVRGLTVIPVNRVVQVYLGLGIEQVRSAEQAVIVCDLLGADALVVPTVTLYDPYDPPKFGGAVQVFVRPGAYARDGDLDVTELARAASPPPQASVPRDPGFVQQAGVFDAANGSVRRQIDAYADGRTDPSGPMGRKEYRADMERFCAFSWHELIRGALEQMDPAGTPAPRSDPAE